MQTERTEEFEISDKKFKVVIYEPTRENQYEQITVHIYRKNSINPLIPGSFTKDEVNELLEDLKHLGKWGLYKKLKQELRKEEEKE